MTANEIILNQSSTPEEYAAILKGRYVTSIGEYGTITLDNGTELDIDGNEGCGGCESGWKPISGETHVRVS